VPTQYNRNPSIHLSAPNASPPNRMPTPGLRVANPPPEPVVRAHSSASLRTNKPTGLQIQFPPMDVILREGTPPMAGRPRAGSRASPPVPVGRFQRKESKEAEFLELPGKSNNRLEDQRGPPRQRRMSPERTRRVSPERTYPRKMSVEREPRGRPAEVKRSHMRSPSSPLPSSPQAALYKDEPIHVEIVPQEHVPQFTEPRYGGPRVHTRGKSSSPISPEESRQDYDDERYYYTSPRQGSRHPSPARNRSRGRGRVKEIKASHMRSPSSPLPFTPQAQLYQEMSDEVDRQYEQDEYHRQPRRAAQSQTRGRQRMDSRTRGPQPRTQGHDLRHSRSEHTLRQWSEALERGNYGGSDDYALNRGVSPAPSTLSRRLSARGLPSNPKVWRAELQANSRGNSPAPLRGRSPPRSMSVAPAPPARGMERHMSPAPRMMSHMETHNPPALGQRLRSPAPPSHRTMSPSIGIGRTMSVAPVHRGLTPTPFESAPRPPVTLGSLSMAASPTPSPYESVPPPPPPPPPLPAMAMAPAPAPYESIQDQPLPAMAMVPMEAPYESIPTARPPQQQIRANTPAPAPAPAPPPPQQYRSMTPGPQYSRSMSTTPALSQHRSATPGPQPSQFRSRTPAPAPRAASRARGRSRSRGRDDNPRSHYHGSPSNNEYEEPPSLASVARSSSHTRGNSDPSFKPLIRKLPPMPLSPPPLPEDLPVHSALQMHLGPGKERSSRTRDRSVRRVGGSLDLTPESDYGWDRKRGSVDRGADQWGGSGGYEYHGQDYQGQYPNPDAYYEEMNQMEEEMRARRAMSPTPTLRGAGGVGMI